MSHRNQPWLLSISETEIQEGNNPDRAESQQQKFKDHLGMSWFQLPSVPLRHLGKWRVPGIRSEGPISWLWDGGGVHLVSLVPHGIWNAGGDFSEKTCMLSSVKGGRKLGRQEQRPSSPPGLPGNSCTSFKR